MQLLTSTSLTLARNRYVLRSSAGHFQRRCQLVFGNALNRELHRAVFHRTLAWTPAAVPVSSFRPEHRVLLNAAGKSLIPPHR
jgi:hypothetical protein